MDVVLSSTLSLVAPETMFELSSTLHRWIQANLVIASLGKQKQALRLTHLAHQRLLPSDSNAASSPPSTSGIQQVLCSGLSV